jgi:hypothetical protein
MRVVAVAPSSVQTFVGDNDLHACAGINDRLEERRESVAASDLRAIGRSDDRDWRPALEGGVEIAGSDRFCETS